MTPGNLIKDHVLRMASDKKTVFSQSIDNFLRCTLESKKTDSLVLMRNVRQFMTGMKNYLIENGGKKFKKVMKKDQNRFKFDLDVILEDVLNMLVIQKLQEHIRYVLLEEYENNGSIPLLIENIQYAKYMTIQDFEGRNDFLPPNKKDLEEITKVFQRLKSANSPMEKLDHLLSSIYLLYKSVRNQNKNQLLSADDLIPLMIWVLVQCNVFTAEIEANYMKELILPSRISSDALYYLITFEAATLALKNNKFYMESKRQNDNRIVKTLCCVQSGLPNAE